MPLQKVFLPPPLKGLNLYDNPFTMSPDYAVDLTNFMPPTTTFTIRPGVERLMNIEGQIRGIYSYTTGSVVDYGENWYNSNVTYGAASFLLIKIFSANGTTSLYSFDIATLKFDKIGDIDNSYYNDDCAMYKHTLFFASGANDSAAYLYHQAKGLASFVLSIGQDGHQNVGNMLNVTVFKDFLFFSTAGSSNVTSTFPPWPSSDKTDFTSDNALNIFFIKGQYADILDPMNSGFWKTIENIFVSHYGSCFSLDGIVQNGGNIIKLCNISRSGSDSVSTYLAAITDQGEIVLFDGTDPSDVTGKDWIVAGKFQIPPPLNKTAFADMEGDLIVVTKNGLVSLRRVIFGQATQITENLEYKLMSLFSQYMFTIPSFSQFIGLFYHQKNRLLIFNVPEDLPMPFVQIVPTYNFDTNKSLVFAQIDPMSGTATFIALLTFVKNYIVKYCLNYNLIIEFNGDMANSRIKLGFTGTVSDPDYYGRSAVIKLVFSIKENANSDEISFFSKDALSFNVVNIEDVNSDVTLDPTSELKWNPDLYNATYNQFLYRFKNDDLIVTNIAPNSSLFYQRRSPVVTLGTIPPNTDITQYQQMYVSDEFYGLIPTQYSSSVAFFLLHTYNGYVPFGQFLYYPTSNYYNDDSSKLSLIKLMVSTFSPIVNSGDYQVFKDNPYEVNFTYPLQVIIAEGTPYERITDCSLNVNFHYYNGEDKEMTAKESRCDFTQTITSDDPEKPFYKMTCTVEFGTQLDSTKWYTNNDTQGVVLTNPKLISFNDSNAKFVLKDGVTNMWSFAEPSTKDQQKAVEVLQAGFSSINPNDIDFVNTIGWYYYNCGLALKPPNSKPKGANDEAPTTLTNVDLSSIPILNKINIMCNYKSRQYVFDSHFGSWSCFEGVNMIKGIEHNTDFYFTIADNVQYNTDAKEYVISNSTLCRFNSEQFGDMTSYDPKTYVPIVCSYKTVPTFDLGIPNKKIFKKLKMFGNPSVFWQMQDKENPHPLPLKITPYWDFKAGSPTSFIHAFDTDNSIREKLLKKHFLGKKFHELDFSEHRKFWKLYKAENDMLSQVLIPLIANPGTRFGLEIEMIMMEAAMNLYGFELYFEPTSQIL